MAHRRPTQWGIALTALIAVVAACSGTVAPTPAATTGTLPTAAQPTSAPTTPPATPRVTEPPAAPLELLWEASGDTAVTGPVPGTYSPAVDPLSGDIWVSMSSSTVWIFASDGTYKGSFGEPGDGPGEFDFRRPACLDCPAVGALAFAPDGSLFIADVGNHRVQKFDPAHEFVTEWGGFGAGEGQFADAIQIATNGREVYVADDARGDLQVFDVDGAFLQTFPVSGWATIGAQGNLYVTVDNAVHSYDADGQGNQIAELPNAYPIVAIGLAVDDRGRLFFNLQNDQTAAAVGLGELDPSTGDYRVWSTGGETLAIFGDVIYQANYTGSGWPKPALRAYALPTD